MQTDSFIILFWSPKVYALQLHHYPSGRLVMGSSPRASSGSLLLMPLTLAPGSHSILDSIRISRQPPTTTCCLFFRCGRDCDMKCRSFRHWWHLQWSWIFIHPPSSIGWPTTCRASYLFSQFTFFWPSALLPSLCWWDNRESSWSCFVFWWLFLSQGVWVLLFYKWKTYFSTGKVLSGELHGEGEGKRAGKRKRTTWL